MCVHVTVVGSTVTPYLSVARSIFDAALFYVYESIKRRDSQLDKNFYAVYLIEFYARPSISTPDFELRVASRRVENRQ